MMAVIFQSDISPSHTQHSLQPFFYSQVDNHLISQLSLLPVDHNISQLSLLPVDHNISQLSIVFKFKKKA
jgi:hypothetical protein